MSYSKEFIADLKTNFRLDRRGWLIRKTRMGGNTFIGQKVQGVLSDYGYYRIHFRKRQIYLHQVIFAFAYGFIPPLVDHRNQKKTDNRPCNLRPVSWLQSAHNMPLRKDNVSGIAGLHFNRVKKRWIAKVTVNGHTKALGVGVDRGVLEKKLRRFRREIQNQL